MSIINKLLRLFTGNKQPQSAAAADPAVPERPFSWSRSNDEETRAMELRIKAWLVAWLRRQGPMPFSWESGSDEAFLSFSEPAGADQQYFYDLEDYLIRKLDIPSAGEFAMNGNGTVRITGNTVKVQYSSAIRELIDYDEVNEKEVYGAEEPDSGELVLFTV